MVRLLILLSLLTSTSYATTKIAIIDTGLDLNDPRFAKVLCPSGHKDLTNTSIEDQDGHGTHVAGLVAKYAGDSNYCMIIIKYYNPLNNNDTTFSNALQAFFYAKEQKVDIINFSSGGPNYEPYEKQIISEMSNVLFIVAAGNNSKSIDNPKTGYYPASYGLPNVIPIGNINKDGVVAKSSNYGDLVKFWEVGVDVESYWPGCKNCINRYNSTMRLTGTSMSTAIFSGKLIKNRSILHAN